MHRAVAAPRAASPRLRAFSAGRIRGSREGSWRQAFRDLRRMNEEFAVAVATRDGAVEPALHLQPELRAAIADALLDHRIQGRIVDDAALADLSGLQLELRLDEHQEIAAVPEKRNKR